MADHGSVMPPAGAATATITPFLWFDRNAEEAANFYISVFGNGTIHAITRYLDDPPGPPGTVMTVEFEVNGQRFVALNGGPRFTFNEAISFTIECADQAQVDYFWERLCADGGEESYCGWLKDKYGLSWQVTPTVMIDMIKSGDERRTRAAMNAMFEMRKLDIAALQRAWDAA
jgi:predicted 3-demethylubiquinone-9 3-methyltransferase (glyoxalase superfamily)